MSRITLSFDNGPDPEVTPRVLDVLRSSGVTAHFFVLGRLIESEQGYRLAARARDEGHLIGNHSFSHTIPLGEDPRADAVEVEIAATEALLVPLVADGPRRFRPFGGGGVLGPHLLSPRAVDYLTTHGYSCVLWNSVPRDWVDPVGWVENALVECASLPHALVVLHDIPGACLDGLERFIHAARERGMEFGSDLPLECVPICEGRVVGDLAGIVAR
jgi:peptidoglycan/xylan/chitin deacetylase (PgdA/CDA1 family)